MNDWHLNGTLLNDLTLSRYAYSIGRKCQTCRIYPRARPKCLKRDCTILTFNVRGPSYLGLTRSISWLLLPWLLVSPGHQQPWYWLCKIGKSWSYMRKAFSSVWSKDIKCRHMFMFPLKNLACKELRRIYKSPSYKYLMKHQRFTPTLYLTIFLDDFYMFVYIDVLCVLCFAMLLTWKKHLFGFRWLWNNIDNTSIFYP